MKHVVITDQARCAEFCEWLYQHGGVNAPLNVAEARTLAYALVHDDGTEEILTVCALTRWKPHSCEASLASDGSKRSKASREYIWTIFDYVFRFAGRSRLETYVAVDNHKSIAVQYMLGLKQEAQLEDHFGEGKDALLFGITQRQWQKGPWASQEQEKEAA
jgi:RimJ/RimL family protein N-acetyltransferase